MSDQEDDQEIYMSDEDDNQDIFMSDEEEDCLPVLMCKGCVHNICKVPMPKVGYVKANVSGEVKLIDVKAYFYLKEEGYNVNFECSRCIFCEECKELEFQKNRSHIKRKNMNNYTHTKDESKMKYCLRGGGPVTVKGGTGLKSGLRLINVRYEH